jgi:hypothetical protein
MAGAFATTVDGADSFAFGAGGLGAVGAIEIDGVLMRVLMGAVRGGGGGGSVAVAETGEERTALVSTSGAGALG